MSDLKEVASSLAEYSEGPVFGIPGSGPILTVIDELEKHGRPFITTAFEGSAALMAAAYGGVNLKKGTKKPALAMSIKGPGFANLVAGLATARMDSLPVVGVTEAYPAQAPASKQHKRIDHASMLNSVSKGSVSLSETREQIAGMIGMAVQEKPGPVVIELAQKDAQDLYSDKAVKESNSEGEIHAWQRLLDKSKKPVLILGSLATRSFPQGAFKQIQVPVFSTAMAKGVIDERGLYAAGVFTGVGRELSPEYQILQHADLVVSIGLIAEEVLNFDAIEVPLLDLQANPEICCALNDRHSVISLEYWDYIADWFSAQSWGQEQVADSVARMRKTLLDAPFLPAQSFDLFEGVFGTDAAICLDTGYFCTIAEHMLRCRTASMYVASANARSMGASIPMAIGASLCQPEKPMVVFVGDGGIGMFFSELQIAVRHKLPLLVVVMSDGGFSSIEVSAKQAGKTTLPLVNMSTAWGNVAESFGMGAYHARTADTFVEALKHWKRNPIPSLLHVEYDKESYFGMASAIRP